MTVKLPWVLLSSCAAAVQPCKTQVQLPANGTSWLQVETTHGPPPPPRVAWRADVTRSGCSRGKFPPFGRCHRSFPFAPPPSPPSSRSASDWRLVFQHPSFEIILANGYYIIFFNSYYLSQFTYKRNFITIFWFLVFAQLLSPSPSLPNSIDCTEKYILIALATFPSADSDRHIVVFAPVLCSKSDPEPADGTL